MHATDTYRRWRKQRGDSSGGVLGCVCHWYTGTVRHCDKGHLSRKRARCCENRRTASTDEYRRPSEPKRIRACTSQPLWPRQESTHSRNVTL
jgi:hypothetical protein